MIVVEESVVSSLRPQGGVGDAVFVLCENFVVSGVAMGVMGFVWGGHGG